MVKSHNAEKRVVLGLCYGAKPEYIRRHMGVSIRRQKWAMLKADVKAGSLKLPTMNQHGRHVLS